MDLSVFEVVGPIMVGPSSSHTAGMVRIGMMVHRIVGEPVSDISIRLSPKMHHTYSGHRTDAGLIGGVIGMSEDSDQIRDAISIAHERGVTTSVSFLEEGRYPQNTALLTITCRSSRVVRVLGTSVGGGSIRISEIDGCAFTLEADAWHIVVWGGSPDLFDAPEACRKIQHAENGEASISVLTFEGAPEDGLAEKIRSLPGVLKVSVVDPVIRYGSTKDTVRRIDSCRAAAELAEKEQLPLSEIAVRYEKSRSGFSEEDIRERMRTHYAQMKKSVKDGQGEKKLCYGLVSGDESARLLKSYLSGKTVSGGLIPLAAARAMGVMESNASMGCIVAAPTAGSSGIMPGSMTTIQDQYGFTDEQMVDALFVGALVGVIMDNRGASFSGSVGGCQAEVGISAAMTAAGIVSLFTDDPDKPFQAMAIAVKNLLGLVCDPIAGPIEVPCIKRNVIGVAAAFTSADLVLAGIDSFVPPNDVIDALIDTQKRLPSELKCSSLGGLASTATACRVRRELGQE